MRALIVILFLATAAHAEHEALFGSHIRALHSSSANALTEDSLSGPTFGYGYRLPVKLLSKLELWGTASMQFGFVDGEMFQTLDTTTHSFELALGARARYPLWRQFVYANARLDAGTERVWVKLEDMQHHEAQDVGWGAISTAAIGLEVNPLALSSWSLGFRAELGMVMTSGIGIDARADGPPDDTIELDRMAASLGHLDLGGRYFSFTVTSRF